MAYKNQKKNKAHNKEVHRRDRDRKRMRERERAARANLKPAPNIDQMMRMAGLI